MRNKITLLLLLILSLSNICYSQSGWFESQTDLVFRGLHKNGNMINIACEGGSIIRTTDNGYSWKYIRNSDILPSYNIFYCVYFLNDATGWAAGFSNILMTTNSGMSWSQVYSTGRVIMGMDFVNPNTGYAVGGSQYPYNILLKTTNQGLIWYSISPPTLLSFSDIRFINSTTGFIVGDSGLVMKSINSGSNWSLKKLETSRTIRSIFFIDENTGWVGGDSGRIFNTTNSGLNWNQQSTFMDSKINKIFFGSNNSGMCAADSGIILLTSNGGLNWHFAITDTKYNLYSIVKTDNGNMLAFGGKSEGMSTIVRQHVVYMSTNDGQIWDEIISGNNYGKWSVYFLDTLIGYVGGEEGTLMKTTNCGLTWMLQNMPTSTRITKIQFLDYNIGWASSWNGDLSHTTNGGVNWTSFPVGLLDFYFFDPLNGIDIGNGHINRSSNSGLNWASIIAADASRLFFTGNKFGWAYGDGAWPPSYQKIYRTTDSGNTWAVITLQFLSNVSGLHFIDSLNGWLCIPYPIGNMNILKSTDGGISWSEISNNYGRTIYFLNNTTGFLLRESSYIYKTSNSGYNWFNSLYYDNVGWWHEIQFVNENFGWAVGSNDITGNIVYTNNGGGAPINIRKIETVIPINFILSQNYPNPFNPVTRIKFDLLKSSNVKLVIYDVLGREIETLIDENKKPGTYEIDWDGSSYASGVYFYKLITNDYVETKKMVLLK